MNTRKLRVRATIYPTNCFFKQSSSGCFPLSRINKNSRYIKFSFGKKGGKNEDI